MKGSNTFKLNEETMIEAVQEYLDKRITKDTPVVTSVTVKSGIDHQFTILLSEKENKEDL